MILKAENESLRNENYRLQTALRNVVCPNCGGPCVIGGEMGLDEQQVRLENARLREEVPMLLNYILHTYSSYIQLHTYSSNIQLMQQNESWCVRTFSFLFLLFYFNKLNSY